MCLLSFNYLIRSFYAQLVSVQCRFPFMTGKVDAAKLGKYLHTNKLFRIKYFAYRKMVKSFLRRQCVLRETWAALNRHNSRIYLTDYSWPENARNRVYVLQTGNADNQTVMKNTNDEVDINPHKYAKPCIKSRFFTFQSVLSDFWNATFQSLKRCFWGCNMPHIAKQKA